MRKAVSKTQKNPVFITIFNYFIYILIFLFAVVFDKESAFPADGLRWLYLNIAAVLLPFLMLIYLSRSKLNLKISIFHILVFSFLGWFYISGFWAVDKANFIEQSINHISLILLIFFFSFYAGKMKMLDLIKVFSITLLFVSFIGTMQFLGFAGDFFKQSASPASTFVNKNLATPLISLLLPFVFFGLISIRSKLWSIILTISFAFSITYLMVAATRSSWLSILVSSILITSMILLNKTVKTNLISQITKKRIINIMIAIVFMILVFCIRNIKSDNPKMTTNVKSQIEALFKFKEKNTDQKEQKIKSIKTQNENLEEKKERKREKKLEQIRKNQDYNSQKSIKMRIAKWRNGLEMIKDKPLTGFGLGSFEAAYPLYFKKAIKDPGYNAGYFHGGIHNDLFQFAIELGIPGLAIFIAILLTIFYFLIKLIKRSTKIETIFFLSCLAGISGLLVESFFNYPLRHPTYMFIFAIIIGLISGIYSRRFPKKSFRLKIQKPISYILIAVLLIMLIFSFQISAKRFKADRDLRIALQLEKIKKPKTAWNYMKKAIDQWPYRSSNLMRGTVMCFTNYNLNKSARNFQEVIKYNNLALKNLPYHFHPNIIRNGIFLEGERWKKITNLENYIKLMLSVAPDGELSTRAFGMAGYLYYLMEEYKKSLNFYLKLDKLHPGNKNTNAYINMLRRKIAETE
ncbi:MAG: O-antigen ligase family protein [Candidatus Cloacimonetes bacterium]|nr:O-antigen ligase family protein [Candidatus Cloacimonadota bacterium]